MKNFDINRFGNVLKWELVYNRQKTVRLLLTWFAVAFLLFLFIDVFTQSPIQLQGTGAAFFWTFTVVLGILSGSFIQNSMKTRQNRIDYLMLPASNLEKFLARYLNVTIISYAGFLLAFLTADVLQYLLMLVFDASHAEWITAGLVSLNGEGGNPDSNPLLSAAAGLVAFWWIHSVYVLGGMFFRRLGWLWTTLIWQFAGTTLAVGCGWMVYKLLHVLYGDTFRVVLLDGAEKWLTVAYFVVMVGLVALNYWLGYRLFTRLQVINNRWFNK